MTFSSDQTYWLHSDDTGSCITAFNITREMSHGRHSFSTFSLPFDTT